MAYTLNGKTLRVGKAFTGTDGTQYPSNWLSLTSDAEKEAIGIVITPDPLPYDREFYWGYDSDNNLIPKALLDETSGGITTEGLRTKYSKNQSEVAFSILAPTDWYVIRKYERDVDIPVGISSFRSEVTQVNSTREGMIDATTSVDQLRNLVTGVGTAVVGYTTTYLPAWPNLDDYT